MDVYFHVQVHIDEKKVVMPDWSLVCKRCNNIFVCELKHV